MNSNAANLHRRRGIASVLAMLFLVLFATLAVGFYAETNVATQVSANDDHFARAFTATESGMEFMRYQLSRVNIPPTDTTAAQVAPVLYSQLQTLLNGTGNMGSKTISQPFSNVIWVPGNINDQINLDADGDYGFRSSITVNENGVVQVTTTGRYGSTSGSARAIQLQFSRVPHTTSVFDYAVASKGQIVMQKGTVSSGPGVPASIATMMSDSATAGAITVSGGTIGGDLNYISGGGVSVSGGSVGGTTSQSDIMANHVHEVSDPQFPIVDTSQYLQYATNSSSAGTIPQGTYANLHILAGTNPKFTGKTVIQGIMYVDSPNKVVFQGDCQLQGFIVFAPGTSTTDILKFTGNLTMSPLQSSDPAFDFMRTTTGVAVLAPNAAMSMTGSAGTGKGGGNITGNVIVNTFNFQGASNLTIDQGTLMTLNPNANSAVFNGSKSVLFNSTGANNQPKVGLTYNAYYEPEAGSYSELHP